MFMLTG